jgi:Mlc titration factor MtfA (ptsG expression regulator)
MAQETPWGIVLILLFLSLGGVVFFAAWSSGLVRFTKRLSEAELAILRKYAIHYQRLAGAEKRRFEEVVFTFIHDKEWRGAGMEVADEMKVMISACAAQLLIGFPKVVLQHFERIVVYPDTYRSARSGKMHEGEVRPQAGVIVISWQDFLYGYSHTQDAHNVGLHEMAHGLWFENRIENGEDNFLHPELLQDWIEHADAEIDRIRAGHSRLFRAYAGSNQPEFFAVAVEYFFEQPGVFQRELPELYAVLSSMLRQDPAAHES